MVICPKCGNNCCNGGYGKVDGKTCDVCPLAYQYQSFAYAHHLAPGKNEMGSTDTIILTNGTTTNIGVSYFEVACEKIKKREWKRLSKKYDTLYAEAWKMLAR
jgi:hypothetical protein